MITKVNTLRELQSATEEELRRRRTLLPSVLDRVFKGEGTGASMTPSPSGRVGKRLLNNLHKEIIS